MKIFTIAILIFAVYVLAGRTPRDFDDTFQYYEAAFIRNYDGDTITCDIELGLGVVLKGQVVRLYGIDTPEIRGGTKESKARARRAKTFLASKLKPGDKFLIRTEQDKRGKYGRVLATCFVGGVNLNREMLILGLAKPY